MRTAFATSQQVSDCYLEKLIKKSGLNRGIGLSGIRRRAVTLSPFVMSVIQSFSFEMARTAAEIKTVSSLFAAIGVCMEISL